MKATLFGDFEGKMVVGSGASSGIGRAVAVELSRQGAKLILIGRNEEKLKGTAELLGSFSSVTVPLDLRDHSQILPRLKEISQKKGRLYGLCRCAGIVETRPLVLSKLEVSQGGS